MKSTIKQILREDTDKTITCEKCGWHWKESETTKNDMYNCHKCGKDNTPKLSESLTRNDINSYLLDFGYFITLNLSKVQSEAIDQNAQIALKKMQERLRAPIINGKTFIDITDLNKTLKSELFKPEFIKGVLTQIRAFLPYIKQHIERFVKDGHYKTAWLSRIDNLEKGYINIVNQPKPVNEHLQADKRGDTIGSSGVRGDVDLKKGFEQIAKNYPDSELAGQDGNTIGLSKITVDGEDIYIQAIEHPNIPNAKPTVAWNSKGEDIALALFRKKDDGTWYSMQSETNRDMYRKGIMTAIYDLAEKTIGKIVPSKELSPSAIKFWEKRNSKAVEQSLKETPKAGSVGVDAKVGEIKDEQTELYESIRRKVLKEYLSQDMVSLYQYFKTSREDREKYLPYEYPYQFDQFAIEYKLQDLKDKFEEEGIETYEIPDILESEHPEVLEQFGKWLYMMIEDGDLGENKADYPTWYFFDDAKVVKNQWLIHFTNDADSIAIEGFTRGVNEMDKLGLTTHFGDFYKKYGGYNFAYKVEDYAKYAHSNRSFGGYKFKYGKEAVIFNASGLRLWHNGDEEPQVIFFGDTAKNIIPIVEGENSTWSVRNAKTNRVIFENDNFDKVVQWVINNFIQYKNAI
jgi:hypothetical protein